MLSVSFRLKPAKLFVYRSFSLSFYEGGFYAVLLCRNFYAVLFTRQVGSQDGWVRFKWEPRMSMYVVFRPNGEPLNSMLVVLGPTKSHLQVFYNSENEPQMS